MLLMTHLQQSLASWRSLPWVAVHGLTSGRGVTPWVPFLPESVKTEPQQDEAHGLVYYDLPLLHQPASGQCEHRGSCLRFCKLDIRATVQEVITE